MKFGPISVADAEGAILAHSVRTDQRVLKKGLVLDSAALSALRDAGIQSIVAARLETDDVPEDDAAAAIGAAALGDNATLTAPFTGRCNIVAASHGIAQIDEARLGQINRLDEALTIATVPRFAVVAPRQLVATVKIIPFAAPRAVVSEAEKIAASGGPLVRVAPFRELTGCLILSRLPGTKESILDNTVKTVRARLRAVDGRLVGEDRVDHDISAIAGAVSRALDGGCDLLFISGASAIVDRRDIVPAAIEASGGMIDHFGMPVDPGNLLLLGHMDRAGERVPVIGLPGCARSPKLNGFDWVLERLAAGLTVTRDDIMAMGAGGLLKEIPSRPQPRTGAEIRHGRDTGGSMAPRIAAIVLAAGRSRRMGPTNKLLAKVDGVAMVRHAVDAACAAGAAPIVVVTGHEADAVRAALAGTDVVYVHNPDYTDGLSGSLRHGVGALNEHCDGAVVCLGDMPRIGADHIRRLIAAFDPIEGRAICVPVHRGKRGNPVLWAARFLTEMTAVAGDVGAKHLIGEHAELVCEVPFDDDAVLLDVDTPDVLAAVRKS